MHQPRSCTSPRSCASPRSAPAPVMHQPPFMEVQCQHPVHGAPEVLVPAQGNIPLPATSPAVNYVYVNAAPAHGNAAPAGAPHGAPAEELLTEHQPEERLMRAPARAPHAAPARSTSGTSRSTSPAPAPVVVIPVAPPPPPVVLVHRHPFLYGHQLLYGHQFLRQHQHQLLLLLLLRHQ